MEIFTLPFIQATNATANGVPNGADATAAGRTDEDDASPARTDDAANGQQSNDGIYT